MYVNVCIYKHLDNMCVILMGFFLHMNIVCVTALGPISLIRFYAPFTVWIAFCLLLNVEWIAIQNYVGLCIYSCSCLMFHTAIKWFWFDLIWMKARRDEDINVIRMSTVEGQYFVDSIIPKYSKDVPSFCYEEKRPISSVRKINGGEKFKAYA